MHELEQLFRHLRQPEYAHLVLNPIPIYGTAAGVIALLISLFAQGRAARIIGLVLIFLAAASVWPVIHYGQAGYDRVKAMSNADAQQWLDLHMDRAERWEYLFYANALLSAASIATLWKFPKAQKVLLTATLVAAIACIAVGAWIGHAGGQIRHSEFRDGPPPGPSSHQHQH